MSVNDCQIDSSNYPYPEQIQMFFGIPQGNMILVNQSNLNQISDVINYLEIDSLSVLNYIQNFEFELLSMIFPHSLHSLLNQYKASFLHLSFIYRMKIN
jgi:hypothetical protein